MAYAPSNNWWLNGPRDPRGWGCDSPGGCGGGLSGFRGLGQASCVVGAIDPSGDTIASCTNGVASSFSTGPVLGGTGVCPAGSTCTWIAGVSDTYIYIGLAIFMGGILLNVVDRGR